MPVSPWNDPSTQTSPPTRSLWDVEVREQPVSSPGTAPAPEPVSAPASQPLRDKTLVIRLTADERDDWHTAAACAGRGKTAAWVRDLVSGWIEAGSVRSTREVADAGRDERDQWRREFARIGNNLNQLTRAVHVAEANGTAVGFPVARELERVATEMRALRAQVERTLR